MFNLMRPKGQDDPWPMNAMDLRKGQDRKRDLAIGNKFPPPVRAIQAPVYGCLCLECRQLREEETKELIPSSTATHEAPTADEISAAKADLAAIAPRIERLFREGAEPEEVLASAMRARGWTFAGKGAFSHAYVKGGLAVKFALRNDPGGSAYTAWARANQGRVGVPVIHEVKAVGKNYYSLMDRLYSLPTSGNLEHYRTYERVRAVLIGLTSGVSAIPLEETARAIHKFFQGVSQFDVHDENVMLDRLGNVIITDPLSSSSAPGVT